MCDLEKSIATFLFFPVFLNFLAIFFLRALIAVKLSKIMSINNMPFIGLYAAHSFITSILPAKIDNHLQSRENRLA